MRRAVLQWPGRPEARAGWTNDELAELYRVEHALTQASFAVETDCGVSDEGDPWFVFCHPDGQVVVHIARIGGIYNLFCVTLPHPLIGSSFAALTKAYVSTIPKPQAAQRADGVVVHPSALLSLLVAAAMLSVDALMQHSAHAADLPTASHGDFLLSEYARPGAAKDAVVKAFTDTFAAVVWRDRGADDPETSGAWQAVEQAALGFAVLYEADLGAEASGIAALGEPTAPAQDVSPPLAEGAPQAGVEETGERRVWTHSSNDERAAGWAAPGGELIASAAKAPPMPMDPQPTPIAGVEGVINAGGDGAGAVAWRPGLSAGPARTASSASVATATMSDGAELAPNSAGARELDVVLAGGESLDLAQGGGLLSLVVSGQGSLALFHAEAANSIDIMSGATADIALFYDATASSAPVSQTLTLGGGTHISLVDASPSGALPVSLVVDSQGAKANHLTLSNPPHEQAAIFSIKIIGEEALTLRESAATFGASQLDASGFAGALTVGVDLSSGPATVTNLSFGSGNFIVKPQDSVALENLGNNATVELGVDLNSAIFGFGDRVSSAAGPIALELDLGTSGQSLAPVSIGLIDANDVSNLLLKSSGGDNAVQTITDPSLTNLQLTGDGALEIGAILGIKAVHEQNVVIDASGLAGFLTLNASMIADLAAAGRQVSIVLGAGGGQITDMAASEAVTVTLGPGQGLLNFADGATLITIAGLKSTDQVNVGDATIADTFINGLALSPSQQISIDALGNLRAAATTAATMASSPAAHQAVHFSYKGDSYVFVDVVGNHVFDPSLDAIIKLVGALPTTDLSGVFHSA